MNLLSLGNSFSEDALTYLHHIAESAGVCFDCMNLYIGGCSLESHAKNIAENNACYLPELNGDRCASLVPPSFAVEQNEYDFITIQQASHYSGRFETYFPYAREIYNFFRSTQRKAKIYIHETWAYEADSTHTAFPDYGCDQRLMFRLLHESYHRMAIELGGLPIIPVGSVVQHFRENVPEFNRSLGGIPLTRDGYHLSIPLGRMLAGYVFAESLLGIDVREAGFIPDGCTESDEELLEVIRNGVHTFMTCSTE